MKKSAVRWRENSPDFFAREEWHQRPSKRLYEPSGEDLRRIYHPLQCCPAGKKFYAFRLLPALAKYGEGLHQVALSVDDLASAKKEMQENGARLIEAGKMIFVHPKDGHGVMYQLVERK